MTTWPRGPAGSWGDIEVICCDFRLRGGVGKRATNEAGERAITPLHDVRLARGEG